MWDYLFDIQLNNIVIIYKGFQVALFATVY